MATDFNRVLFAGGGTGGHVYMAIAIAQELERRQEGVEVLFAGTEEGLESRIVPGYGYALAKIEIGGLKKVGLSRTLRTCAQVPKSLFQSLRIVREFSPRIAVGLGGYSSGPLVAAALLRRVPTLLIEPNVYPGLANRLLARWTSGAAVAFEETAQWFGPRARVTGVPIRRNFFEVGARAPQATLQILIFGGSRGSAPINRLVVDALQMLKDRDLCIVHQTGKEDLEWVRAAYRKAGVEGEVLEYIDEMPNRFEQADLVLSRAGASTIAEISAAGRGAILIPFPHAADDHQRKNAAVLARRGAALMLEQQEATGSDLGRMILGLAEEPEKLVEMGRRARQLARPRATEKIVELMEELVS